MCATVEEARSRRLKRRRTRTRTRCEADVQDWVGVKEKRGLDNEKGCSGTLRLLLNLAEVF